MHRWIEHTAELELAIDARSERELAVSESEGRLDGADPKLAGLAAKVARRRPLGVIKG